MRSYSKIILALTSTFISRGYLLSDDTNTGVILNKSKLSYKRVIVKKNGSSLLTQSAQEKSVLPGLSRRYPGLKDRFAIKGSETELATQDISTSELEAKTSENYEAILVMGVTAQFTSASWWQKWDYSKTK